MVKIVPLELKTHFAEGTVNSFLVIGKSVTLVDTGDPGVYSFQRLKSLVENQGIAFSDLDHIVLTHIHTDHAGGIPLILKEADIPIYVHENARGPFNTGIKQFQENEGFYRTFMEECGADPKKNIIQRTYKAENWRNVSYIKEGDIVPLGGLDFEIIYVPGHSQCDILLWNHDTGDTIIGDHLLKVFSVNAFIEPPINSGDKRPKPLLQYRKSLEKISKLPIKMIYPGHGEPFEDHLSIIELRLLEQENRCRQIINYLQDGDKTIFEVCLKMYPQLQERTVFLGLSQIQGHLDLLEERNQVVWEKRGSLVYYHLR
ncbi:MBL fold metallo-hydrolase [Neobacillus sp. M.A.Huq-85]|nr:MBL fold metallo-hydrolase [Neobacillus cucumis]